MNPAIFDRPSGAGALLGVGDIATPTAGYSLRPLSVGYSGAVVRVRRSGDNEEKDFNSTSITNGTLDDFLITLGNDDHSKEILSDFEDIPDFSLLCACNVGRANELDAVDEFNDADGFVSKWYDQFGSNDATQTTDSAQPKIWDASTGLVTENGKPAVQFDGTSDVLTSSSLFQCNYISYVCTDSKNALSQRFNPTEQQYNWGLPEISGNRAIVLYNPNFFNYQSAVLYTNIQSLMTIQSQDVEIFKNGTSILDTNVNIILGASPNSEKLNIGAYGQNGLYDYFNGKFQEVIIYNTDQSANRTKIEDNINDYYDIY